MIQISEKKWKQIKYIFDYLIPEGTIKICSNCDMPYKNGSVCTYCGCRSDDDDLNEDFSCEEYKYNKIHKC